MAAPKELPIIFFSNAAAWEQWLEQHYMDYDGIWIKFAKKASGIPTVVYAEALDGALCYGWIDGQSKTLDDTYYLQKFTPRRPRSIWSKRNVEKVAQLIAAKRMKSSGLAAVEAAKQDGRWERAYESASKITVPADFQIVLDEHPTAKAFFATLNQANRYAFLFRIHTAKRPETRAKRIALFIEMLSEHKTFH